MTIGDIWFCEEINKMVIRVLKIDTVGQMGDILTKGLPRSTFEYLRKNFHGLVTVNVILLSRGSVMGGNT